MLSLVLTQHDTKIQSRIFFINLSLGVVYLSLNFRESKHWDQDDQRNEDITRMAILFRSYLGPFFQVILK